MRLLLIAGLATTLASGVGAALRPGQKAPHFSLTDLNGKVWTPEKDSRHKVLLIDFWASWCAPCLKEIPTLKQLQAAHGNGGSFQVLGVSMEKGGRPASEAAAVKYAVDYPVLLGSPDTAVAFEVKGFPTAILILDAKVLKVFTGERKLRDFEVELAPYLQAP
jgi:thiol-disulfide isomerase/thioredoxin